MLKDVIINPKDLTKKEYQDMFHGHFPGHIKKLRKVFNNRKKTIERQVDSKLAKNILSGASIVETESKDKKETAKLYSGLLHIKQPAIYYKG